MTNNIEKLYELAAVKKIGKKYSCGLLEFGDCRTSNCDICDKARDKNYPPFTDTKQLELIKLLAFEKRFSLKYINAKWSFYNDEWGVSSTIKYEPFEQALAGLVCVLWKNLTPEQKEEVRKVLE